MDELTSRTNKRSKPTKNVLSPTEFPLPKPKKVVHFQNRQEIPLPVTQPPNQQPPGFHDTSQSKEPSVSRPRKSESRRINQTIHPINQKLLAAVQGYRVRSALRSEVGVSLSDEIKELMIVAEQFDPVNETEMDPFQKSVVNRLSGLRDKFLNFMMNPKVLPKAFPRGRSKSLSPVQKSSKVKTFLKRGSRTKMTSQKVKMIVILLRMKTFFCCE
ncbi:hypothetical protein GEMRC1_006223 [Eukaryota sp. GEM-RC1]